MLSLVVQEYLKSTGVGNDFSINKCLADNGYYGSDHIYDIIKFNTNNQYIINPEEDMTVYAIDSGYVMDIDPEYTGSGTCTKIALESASLKYILSKLPENLAKRMNSNNQLDVSQVSIGFTLYSETEIDSDNIPDAYIIARVIPFKYDKVLLDSHSIYYELSEKAVNALTKDGYFQVLNTIDKALYFSSTLSGNLWVVNNIYGNSKNIGLVNVIGSSRNLEWNCTTSFESEYNNSLEHPRNFRIINYRGDNENIISEAIL